MSNVFSHMEQAYGYSPVWILSCFFKSTFVYVSCHFPPVWVLICVFKWALWLNTLSHFEKGNGFSTLWILVKCLFTFGAGIWLFTCVDPYMYIQNVIEECMFTFESEKRFLFHMDPFMYLHFTPCFKCLVTFGAIKWIISFVGSIMFLQLFTVLFGFFHVFFKFLYESCYVSSNGLSC